MTPLLAEVPVVAPVGAGVLAAIGLVAFLGFIVATGTLKIYAHSFGYLIRWLAEHLDVGVHIPAWRTLHPFHSVAAALLDVDTAVRNGIASVALHSEESASWAFAQAGALLSWMGDEVGGLAYDVVQGFRHVQSVSIPNALLDAEHRAADRLRGLETAFDRERAKVADDLARLRVGIDRISSTIRQGIDAELARAHAQVIGLEHGLGLTDRRVRSLERRFGVAALTAAVALAVTKVAGSWWRCTNVRHLGRRVCGMDPSTLEQLLLGTLAVYSLASVRELAQELLAAEQAIHEGLHRLIREFPGGNPLDLHASSWPAGHSSTFPH